MRRRSLVFPQQCYADDGMWMETHQAQQQQQQQSYAFHEEESWNSEHNNNNNHHHAIHNHKQQQFPGGMHMKPGAAAFAMDHSKHHGMPGSGHGHGHGHGFGGYGNKKFPFGAPTTNNYNNAPHHHQFPNGGGARFNNNYGSHGHHRDYIAEEEEYEYEAYHSEEHVGGVKGKMEEMRYEHRNWGGGDVRYANPYGGYNNNNNMKPHGHGGHKVEWTAKGV